MRELCERISPESGTVCFLLDTEEEHRLGHQGRKPFMGTKWTGVTMWAVDIFDRIRWARQEAKNAAA